MLDIRGMEAVVAVIQRRRAIVQANRIYLCIGIWANTSLRN
jgi:hypothetical protein